MLGSAARRILAGEWNVMSESGKGRRIDGVICAAPGCTRFRKGSKFCPGHKKQWQRWKEFRPFVR